MLVGEVYPTPIDHGATPDPALEEVLTVTGEHDQSNAEDISETFVKYVKSNDWDNVIKFLRQHRKLAGNAKIPFVVQHDHFKNDIAWDLIQLYPELAMATDIDRYIPLVALANNRFAFKSGSRLSLWEKLIYYG
nr:uncharacterized protein LOC114822528 [Malus domestica]